MKPKISYNDAATEIHNALGIPKKRFEELEYRMSIIIHEFFRPTKDHFLPKSDTILKQFISLAENHQELVFVSFVAGVKTEEMIFNNDEIEVGDDDLEDDDLTFE